MFVYFGLGLLYIGLNVVIACLYYGWVNLVWLVVCFWVGYCLLLFGVYGVDCGDGFKFVCDGACLNWLRFELFCGLVGLIGD